MESGFACEHGFSSRTVYFGDSNLPIPCPYCPMLVLQLCFNRLYPNKFFDRNIYTLIFQQLRNITNKQFPDGQLDRCTHCQELRHVGIYRDMFASVYPHSEYAVIYSGFGSRYDEQKLYFCRPQIYKYLGDNDLTYEDQNIRSYFLYKEQVLQEYGIDIADIHWCDECLEYMMGCHILFNRSEYQDMFYEDLY